MKRVLIAISILLSLNTYALATTIVVIWGPSDIVFGADSKITSRQSTEYQLACKIGIQRNVVWAAAGGLAFTDNTSVAGIVDSEMKKGAVIPQTVDNIAGILFSKFSVALSFERATGIFDNKSDRFGVSAIFGYLQDDLINIDTVQIKAPDTSDTTDQMKIIRKHCPNANDSS
jgi:hypothetical protein